MCGIAGLAAKTLTDPFTHAAPGALEAMLRDIESRGRDATGIAWWSDTELGKRIVIDKEDICASYFLTRHDDRVKAAAASGLVIAHTRFPTKGALTDRVNNHPIDTNTIVGVHNGACYNDDELFTRSGETRRGVVDSEAIFATLSATDAKVRQAPAKDRVEAFAKALVDVSGSMAIAFMSKFEPGVLYLAKGDGSPLVSAESVDGTFLFASVQTALASAHRQLGGGDIKFTHHNVGDVVRVDDESITRSKIPYPVKVVTPKKPAPAPTHNVVPLRKPTGTTSERFQWLGVEEADVERLPQLSDMDVWQVFNDVGAVPFVGCFDESDQAQVLAALAHNLFMDPFTRSPEVDLAMSQYHLRKAVEYLYVWLHDDKDQRKFATVLDKIYDSLGAHMVGDHARLKTTSSPKGETVEVRIVGFGQADSYSDFPTGPRVFVQYKQGGDTILRSVAKSTIKPVDTKPSGEFEKRLGWIEDAALALSYCDSNDQTHPLHTWLDPREPIDLATLKAATEHQIKALSAPETPVIPTGMSFHPGYL